MEAQLHASLSKALDAQLRKAPEKKENLDAMKRFMANGRKVPNAKKPILYAIGGRAGIATVEEYAKLLKRERSKNPKVLAGTCSYTAHMMSNRPRGSGRPSSAPTPIPNSPQQASYAAYPPARNPLYSYMHEIVIEVRFPEYLGGDGRVVRRMMTFNDTGANTQGVRRTDWNALNTLRRAPASGVGMSASGTFVSETIILEMRVVTSNAAGQPVPLTPWYPEHMHIIDGSSPCLSGAIMRDHLYFATAPGNNFLIVSRGKQGIVDNLPSV